MDVRSQSNLARHMWRVPLGILGMWRPGRCGTLGICGVGVQRWCPGRPGQLRRESSRLGVPYTRWVCWVSLRRWTRPRESASANVASARRGGGRVAPSALASDRRATVNLKFEKILYRPGGTPPLPSHPCATGMPVVNSSAEFRMTPGVTPA